MRDRDRKSYEQREAVRGRERRDEKRRMTRRDRREANREDKRKAKRDRARNKEFARVTYMFVSLFLVMMGYIVYFNLTQSRDFIRSPYNQRQDALADRIVRGSILDKNGKVLAKTEVGKSGKEYRKYPYGDMFAHVIGYTAKGKTGLEAVENSALLTSNAFFFEKFQRELKDEKIVGEMLSQPSMQIFRRRLTTLLEVLRGRWLR